MIDEEIKLENERLAHELKLDTGLDLDRALVLVTHLRAEADRMVYGLVAVVRTNIRDQAFEEAAKEADKYADVSECAERAAAAIRALIHKPQNPPS
jgi:hypothetical protein